jgi:hypothetical protein
LALVVLLGLQTAQSKELKVVMVEVLYLALSLQPVVVAAERLAHLEALLDLDLAVMVVLEAVALVMMHK